MADIEVVIKIPEEEYRNICLMSKDGIGMALYDWIANGTPLPKGHGRLGDLDALEKLCTEHKIASSAFDDSPMIEQGHYSDGDCIWESLFDFAPTIIEADTESEEKEW